MAIKDPISLIPDFKSQNLEYIVENYALSDFYFKTFFPSVPVVDLTWEAIEAATGAKVAADVVAFNSRSPRKGRPFAGKKTGEIPKIEIAREKTEKDIKVYQILQNTVRASRNQAMAQKLIDWMYGDSIFVLDGVNARMEWLSKQVSSNGKFSLTIKNNEGGVATKYDVDFGVPTANRKTVTINWSDAQNATPITDIKSLQIAARGKGYKLMYATTDQSTIDNMLATAEVQKYCASYVSIALDLQTNPTLETLNSVLSKNGLPQFRVWDSYVTLETKDGKQTSESGWIEGNVTFSVNPQLGEIQWTDTADGIVGVDAAEKATNDFTLVKVWADEDPITLMTKGIAYAIPVLQGTNQINILSTIK